MAQTKHSPQIKMLALAAEFLADAEIDPLFEGEKERLSGALAERIQETIDEFLKEWAPK